MNEYKAIESIYNEYRLLYRPIPRSYKWLLTDVV